MTLRRAFILLRLNDFEASLLVKKYPDIVGKDIHEILDIEITNEQFFDLFIACKDNNVDKRPSYLNGQYFNFRIKEYTDREPSSFCYFYHNLWDDANSKDIKISETNEYYKIKIRIGMILQCFKEDKYGLLLAKRRNISGNEFVKDNKMLYFEKEENTCFPRYTLVAYVEDLENPNRVYHVIDLNEFENAGGEKVMRHGIPYISENSSYNKIGIPHIYTSDEIQYFCNIFYDIYLYHNYLYLSTLRQIVLPDCNEKAIKMGSIKQYVDTFDCNSVIDTFVSKEYGYLQHHRGSDDSYNIISYRTIDTYDSYILSIIPNGLNEKYSIGTSSDKNYDKINIEEMNSIKSKAKSHYSKSDHFEFLKNRYNSSLDYVRQEMAIAQMNIESEFDIHEALSKLVLIECDDIIDLVEKYNSKI